MNYMNISVRKLAQLAGVSSATVSMVLNNKPGIGQETRDRVLAIAGEHGFRPSATAATGQTGGHLSLQMVYWYRHGNVITDNPFFSSLTEGLTSRCSECGCSLQIVYVYEDREDVSAQIESIRSAGSDGILVLATELDLSAKKWLDTFDVPVVLLDISLPGIGYDCVAINNFQAAYDAVDYLFACGHKTIGYFRSGIRISNFNEREHGYWSCLHRHGVDILPAEHIHTLDGDYDSFIKYLSGSAGLADAYLVDNDHLAAALLKAFHDNGYHLPDEVSIIGIDDMPLSDMIVPSLTTMRVDRQSLATTAVDRLLLRIRDPKIPPVRILVDTELVVRDSVRILKETKN